MGYAIRAARFVAALLDGHPHEQQMLCMSPELTIGEVEAVETFEQPITAAGEWLYDRTHTRVTLRVLRRIRGAEDRRVTVVMRGAPDGEGQIPGASLQPVHGSRWWVGGWISTEPSATWPAGTPWTMAALEVGPGRLPSVRGLREAMVTVCTPPEAR